MINTSESLNEFLHREIKEIKELKKHLTDREFSFFDGMEAGLLMVLKKLNGE